MLLHCIHCCTVYIHNATEHATICKIPPLEECVCGISYTLSFVRMLHINCTERERECMYICFVFCFFSACVKNRFINWLRWMHNCFTNSLELFPSLFYQESSFRFDCMLLFAIPISFFVKYLRYFKYSNIQTLDFIFGAT